MQNLSGALFLSTSNAEAERLAIRSAMSDLNIGRIPTSIHSLKTEPDHLSKRGSRKIDILARARDGRPLGRGEHIARPERP